MGNKNTKIEKNWIGDAEVKQFKEPTKRRLSADILYKGALEVPTEEYPLLGKDHVHIFCGFDKVSQEPFVACSDNNVVKSFSWEFLTYFAVKNGLLDSFKESTKGGEQ